MTIWLLCFRSVSPGIGVTICDSRLTDRLELGALCCRADSNFWCPSHCFSFLILDASLTGYEQIIASVDHACFLNNEDKVL
jgi:hypothetical protein